MLRTRAISKMALAAALVVVLGACGTPQAGPDTTDPGATSTTTQPDPPGPDPPTTSTVPTTVPSTTTIPPATTSTTGPSSVLDDAEGSGCTPGPGKLPDGEWFGYVVTTGADQIEFDLACWFTGDAAVRAAKEDGARSHLLPTTTTSATTTS